MKFIEEIQTVYGPMPMVQLTRRNLEGLIEKLDDEDSACMLIDPDGNIAIKAVEDSEHYKTREPGIMLTNGRLH